MIAEYPAKADRSGGRAPAGRQRICIVSDDILGPVRNGGIGTAMTALAELLVSDGHDVTILYTPALTEDRPISFWILDFARRGIVLEALWAHQTAPEASYLIYHWLKHRAFDVVHFHDWRGIGYWPCLAKKLGLAFSKTLFVCQVHGQTYWHLVNSAEFATDIRQLELDYLERRGVELADVVFSPSRYMIGWMEERGWSVPEARFVTPNLLPAGFDIARGKAGAGRAPIHELVFFGRLEARKGLELFCAAVAALADEGVEIGQVTFLGKEGLVGDLRAIAYLAGATANWRCPFVVLNDLDVYAARDYLLGPGRLAVVASFMENSPYTVLECIASGAPFIAPDVGGVRELIHEDDAALAVYAPSKDGLVAALGRVIGHPPASVRPRIGFEENRRRWRDWHAGLAPPRRPQADAAPATPLVSVCISHHGRPELLRIAIESIEKQTYPHIQLVLVDDASPDRATQDYLRAIRPAFDRRGWKIVRSEVELWTGAARNLAAAHADGDYLLLMDDDNVAKPHEVATFVTAALHSGADVLTCQQQPFEGGGHPPPEDAELPIGWMALGPNLPQALFMNCLGDLNMFVRRGVWETLGGFTTERYGCEDWEFLMKVVLAGLRLEAIPELLFYYRHTGRNLAYRYDARQMYDSMRRPLRPVLAQLPAHLRDAIRFGLEKSYAGIRRSGFNAAGAEAEGRILDIEAVPLGGGAAILALARETQRRGQTASARLLYGQALRLAPEGHDEQLDALLSAEDARKAEKAGAPSAGAGLPARAERGWPAWLKRFRARGSVGSK